MAAPTLLQRLKERKLVQWALAYLAGAWALMELVGFLREQFNWPAILGQTVTVLAAFGFFITLVVAWYHGEKGRQKVSGPELLMVAALLVVAGVALSMLPGDGADSAIRADSPANDDPRPSIAVLPCENISPNPEDAFLADGLHGEIISRLQSIPSIRTIGRSSVLHYANQPSSTASVAEGLGVGFVAGCRVRKQPNLEEIRVEFELLDPAGTHVWGMQYDRGFTLDGLFEIQEEIARRVAFEVGVTLTPEEEEQVGQVLTDSREAYLNFIRGNEAYLQERLGGWSDPWGQLESVRFYERALQLDPDFSLAKARLALAGTQTFAWTEWARDSVRSLAEDVLETSPDLAEARLALVYVHSNLGDLDEALLHLDLAQQAAPFHVEVLQRAALAQRRLEDYDEAIRLLEEGSRIHPREPVFLREVQYDYIFAHRYDDALAALRREASITENPHSSLHRRAFIHLAKGERQEAERVISEMLREAPDWPYTYSHNGEQRVVERLLNREQRLPAYEAALSSGTWKETQGQADPELLFNSAIHYAALEDMEAARSHWQSLKERLRSSPLPSFLRQNTFLTLAHLGLEERDQALSTAKELVTEGVTGNCRSRFMRGPRACTLLARVYAHFGEHDAAIDLLEELLPSPSWLTVHILDVDPIWDPLRDHPRFQALLEEYADDVER